MSFSANGLTTSAGATLPIRGTSQDSPWTQLCPTCEVVVGFSGRSGAALDQVAFVCAPLVISDSDAGSVLAVGLQTTLTPAGGDGGTPYDVACLPGQVAQGVVAQEAALLLGRAEEADQPHGVAPSGSG